MRTQRAGSLLDERSPEFLSAVAQGKVLDFWDAVALALGELDEPQTVP
jgi:hypothetical protein